MRPAHGLAVVSLFAFLFVDATARAEEASGASEQLFLDGKKLMQAGRVEEACEKFKASHDADKTATGTLLNLALCNEQRRRTASAWGEFRQVAAESATAHREDRVAIAREHEAKLYPMLSYVTVYVRTDARVSSMRVVLDSQREITEPMWQTKLPIDPGQHTVVVDAPGRIPKTYTVQVKDAADWQSVDVLPLVLAPVPEPATPTTIGNPARRTAGYAIGAIGLAALGTGAVFGGMALDRNSAIKGVCPSYQCPTTVDRGKENDKETEARNFALVTDVALATGTALVLAGAILVWTGRDRPASHTGINVRTAPTTHGGSMLLEGTF